MDGIISNNSCKQNQKMDGPYYGGYVSTNFIRGTGQVIEGVSDDWARGYSYQQSNNTPPIQIFIRILPSLYDPSKYVFWINGYQQPRLFLIKGKNYVFNINTWGYKFYMTTDPIGGNGIVDNITNVPSSDYDKRTYTVPWNTSLTKFYYQCPDVPNMGGEIILLDKHPTK